MPEATAPQTDDERYARIMEATTPMFAAIRFLPEIQCPGRRIDTAMQLLNFAEHVGVAANQELEKLRKGE